MLKLFSNSFLCFQTSNLHCFSSIKTFSSLETTNMSNWFNSLFGLIENPKTIQENFFIENNFLVSRANNERFLIGAFSTPTLKDIRERALKLYEENPQLKHSGKLTLHHLAISDVLEMHAQNPKAVFQCASQFNCLEFPTPYVLPEDGITAYASDRTQGPACAIACAAGTLYRNYFVPIGSQRGQNRESQLNNLDEVERLLNNEKNNYWRISNGYSFSEENSLKKLENVLLQADKEPLRDAIKIGLQEDVSVNFRARYERINDPSIFVTQVYCSALSCAYSNLPNYLWEPFARLVLEGIYEATIWAGVVNALKHGPNNSHSNDVFLTFVGGGVFGNDISWITDAINRAHKVVSSQVHVNLNIYICHYRHLNPEIISLIDNK